MKCQECEKEIPEDYLPSFFCEGCVEEYLDKIRSEKPVKASIHPEFH